MTNSALDNTVIGISAADLMTNGDENTILGSYAGNTLTAGIQNTFLGSRSGYGAALGSLNTFVGFAAGNNGSRNTVIGALSGNSISTGTDNTIIGTSSGNGLTTGSQNVLIGARSAYKLDTGTFNTCIGFDSGNSGVNNVTIGCFAGNVMKLSATDNILIGRSSGPVLTSGGQNILIGTTAGPNVTGGSRNILIGENSGGTMALSSDNIAIGSGINIPGSNNTLIGSNISVQAGGAFRVAAMGTNSLISASGFNETASLFSNNFYASIRGNGDFVVSGPAYKPGGGTWASTSDRRLKSNIESANTIMCENILKNLDLKRFTWNSDFNQLIKDRSQLGFIAQEVEGFLPKSVTTMQFEGLDDCKTLDTSQINMVMFGALKRSIERIDQLEELIANL
jgi:hypothetical protein